MSDLEITDMVWSSPRVLVRTALDEAMTLGRHT